MRGHIVAVMLLAAAPVSAQEFAPLGDEDFALDLYTGAAVGSTRVVGMGGAAIAGAEGSVGMLSNPAAAAVRPPTSHATWDWDWHLDWLSPELGSDFDNNGILSDDPSTAPFVTGGLVGQYGPWALGLSLSLLESPSTTSGDPASSQVSSRLSVARLILARSFLGDSLAVGLGVRTGRFEFGFEDDGSAFAMDGASLELGAIVKPAERSYRLGAAAAAPVASSDIDDDSWCDPSDCLGYVLPRDLSVPWQVSVGAAYRFAPTAWNRGVLTDFRDERSVTIAADLVVTGAVAEGAGLEAFARRRLQPSGREIAVSVRAGAEYEWLPGRLRVRGGSYWEPSRFLDPAGDEVPGRLHVTLGVDLRVWAFCLLDDRYRVRLSLTTDAAERYRNGGVSLGFWH